MRPVRGAELIGVGCRALANGSLQRHRGFYSARERVRMCVCVGPLLLGFALWVGLAGGAGFLFERRRSPECIKH